MNVLSHLSIKYHEVGKKCEVRFWRTYNFFSPEVISVIVKYANIKSL